MACKLLFFNFSVLCKRYKLKTIEFFKEEKNQGKKYILQSMYVMLCP